MKHAALCLTLVLAIRAQNALLCGQIDENPQADAKDLHGSYHKFPWYVTFTDPSGHPKFGGALIANGIVLTAAFGLDSDPNPMQNFQVKLGMSNLCEASATTNIFNIRDIIKHENYNITTPELHDIALVVLKEDTSMFQPICLPEGLEVNALAEGMVFGFGVNEVPRCESRTATLPIYPRSECEWYANNRPSKFISKTMRLCVENFESVLCVGDPGSPLVVKSASNHYEVIGLIPFNFYKNVMTCRISKLTFFTSIVDYKNWIFVKLRETMMLLQNEKTLQGEHSPKAVSDKVGVTFRERVVVEATSPSPENESTFDVKKVPIKKYPSTLRNTNKEVPLNKLNEKEGWTNLQKLERVLDLKINELDLQTKSPYIQPILEDFNQSNKIKDLVETAGGIKKVQKINQGILLELIYRLVEIMPKNWAKSPNVYQHTGNNYISPTISI